MATRQTHISLRYLAAALAFLLAYSGDAAHGMARGFWGCKADAEFESRFLSAEARGEVYEEAVGAFRTHDDDRGWWQGEYWGKHMLGAVAAQSLTGDEGLKKWIASSARAFVDEFQRPDGYIGTHSDPLDTGPNPDGSDKFNWNLWGRKYTMWALIEIYGMTDDRFFLDAASRMMDQEIAQLRSSGVPIVRTGYFAGLPSMSVLKPLVILFRKTGERRYLAFADEIVALWDRDGNPPPNLVRNAFVDSPVHAWYPTPDYWAKAYEMMACLEGLLDYAGCVGGEKGARLVDAVRRIALKLQADEANPMGSVGYFDHFTNARACPNAITELCDVIYWMRLCRALRSATGDGRWADAFESAFLNGFLPGVFRDGKWAAHGVRSHGTRQFPAPRQVGMKHHQCCVDNAPRAWLDASEAAVSLAADGAVVVDLLFAGEYSLHDAKGDVKVRVGGFPTEGKVSIAVESPVSRRIEVRRPAWAKGFDAARSADGSRVDVSLSCDVRIRPWRTKEGADPRTGLFERSDDTPEMAGLARKAPGAYVEYGPLLLAKSTLLGTSRDEVLSSRIGTGEGWTCTLAPTAPSKTFRAWRATFRRGGEEFSVPVCDFSSCDMDDSSAAFSIWM